MTARPSSARRLVVALVVALETLAAWLRERVLGEPVRYLDAAWVEPVALPVEGSAPARKVPGALRVDLGPPTSAGRSFNGRGVVHFRLCSRA